LGDYRHIAYFSDQAPQYTPHHRPSIIQVFVTLLSPNYLKT